MPVGGLASWAWPGGLGPRPSAAGRPGMGCIPLAPCSSRGSTILPFHCIALHCALSTLSRGRALA
eukprot:scaffold1691_cov378-Prasinococcus_capsulatus_cf.AAC.1